MSDETFEEGALRDLCADIIDADDREAELAAERAWLQKYAIYPRAAPPQGEPERNTLIAVIVGLREEVGRAVSALEMWQEMGGGSSVVDGVVEQLRLGLDLGRGLRVPPVHSRPSEPLKYHNVDSETLAAELAAQIPDAKRVAEAYERAGEVSQESLRYEVEPVRRAPAAAPPSTTRDLFPEERRAVWLAFGTLHKNGTGSVEDSERVGQALDALVSAALASAPVPAAPDPTDARNKAVHAIDQWIAANAEGLAVPAIVAFKEIRQLLVSGGVR